MDLFNRKIDIFRSMRV